MQSPHSKLLVNSWGMLSKNPSPHICLHRKEPITPAFRHQPALLNPPPLLETAMPSLYAPPFKLPTSAAKPLTAPASTRQALVLGFPMLSIF